MKRIIFLILISLLLINCQEQKEKSTDFGQSEKEASASIDELRSALNEQEDLKQLVIALSRKKDSLNDVLKSTKESLERINENKIDKGIAGVNKKLDELKGQKENFDEQISLQKKEIDLAQKKIDLLNQEKVVYDQQKKALWDKGAPPKDFVRVDSLLNGINDKILEQSRRVKNLKRNVADVEEQISSIDKQRNFLSTKIRENYNAREIYTEYAKEEESRISLLIADVDLQISKLTGDVNAINTKISELKGDLSAQEQLAQENLKLEEDAEKTRSRINTAFIIIGLVALVFVVLYFVGKKNKKSNK